MFESAEKLQKHRRKLQNGKFPNPEASQLKKSPYTFNSAEPLPHANRHVRDPPPVLATRCPPFLGKRDAEIQKSRGNQRARPHCKTTKTKRKSGDDSCHRNFKRIYILLAADMFRRLTTVTTRICHDGRKTRRIGGALKAETPPNHKQKQVDWRTDHCLCLGTDPGQTALKRRTINQRRPFRHDLPRQKKD